jgi:LysM repeat protein
MLKNPGAVDKIMGNVSGDLIAKCSIKVPMENPQIGSILENNIELRKKEVKLIENKISISAYAAICVLYRGKDTKDIVYMKEEVPISKELDLDGVNPSMESYTDFKIDAVEYNVKEDDLGEDRVIDVEALIKADTKVMAKQELDIIQDAYSPTTLLEMTKKDYQLNVMHGQATYQDIIKEDIELDDSLPKVSKIIMCSGDVSVADKKLVEDKVIVDGVLNVGILYKTMDEEKGFYTINEEIPFSCGVEIPECKIDMQCIAKVSLENIEASIELDRISVKAVVEVYARVNYLTHREFLVDIVPVEEEIPKKKASLTIYVVEHGDTLWKIAKKYYTTVEALVKLNDIEDPDVIKVGDKLIIPGRAII